MTEGFVGVVSGGVSRRVHSGFVLFGEYVSDPQGSSREAAAGRREEA